jgi:hypothetical protein
VVRQGSPKTFHDDVKDELVAVRIAYEAYLEAARVTRSVFQIWLDAFAECHRVGSTPFEPDLSSMIPLERWSFASVESTS